LLSVDHHNRLSHLRAALIGGSHFGAELRREAAVRGIVALASYGLTESCSQVATQRLGETRDPTRLDSGRPLDGIDIRIRNDRIELRGPMLMRGYAGSPSLARDEFFSTGDLGALDDEGRLHVLGRADDVIVSGGENVHPAEIERVCATHPEVTGALAFGMPDPLWGEVVALAIALAPGAAVERVLARLHDDLADFKCPRRVVVVDALPLGPSGKPDRRRARSELSAATRAIS
jgi:O-succinylbenzoic acid--CoA ligase